MASNLPVVKNQAHTFHVLLPSQANPKIFQETPTIAAGDFKVLISGSWTNLTTLPSIDPAGSNSVLVSLSAAEMNQDEVCWQAKDVAGAEWCSVYEKIQTVARRVDDLAYPATSGRSIAVSSSGVIDADVKLLNGSTTDLTTFLQGVKALITGQAITGTLSTTEMTTNLTFGTSDIIIGRTVAWTTGSCVGQIAKIDAYDQVTKKITYSNVNGDPLALAPANGDAFVIA